MNVHITIADVSISTNILEHYIRDKTQTTIKTHRGRTRVWQVEGVSTVPKSEQSPTALGT